MIKKSLSSVSSINKQTHSYIPLTNTHRLMGPDALGQVTHRIKRCTRKYIHTVKRDTGKSRVTFTVKRKKESVSSSEVKISVRIKRCIPVKKIKQSRGTPGSQETSKVKSTQELLVRPGRWWVGEVGEA